MATRKRLLGALRDIESEEWRVADWLQNIYE